MTKPIPATPVVCGKDALVILNEINSGTPLTPERVKIFKEVEEIRKRYPHIFGK